MNKASLILDKATVITQDPTRPQAQAVAVGGDRILAVGSNTEVAQLRGPATKVIDCRGQTLIPGFVDAHIHLLRFAQSLVGVDCSPARVSSIAEIGATIAERAKATPPGQWIRAYGYHEFYLVEGRHPSRHDLDAAAPHHPVRLSHQSGHASVLNSLALSLAGIDATTEEPPGGYMERDSDGEPTGLFLEMEASLTQRVGHRQTEDELAPAIAKASDWLLAHGVTSVEDASRTNGPDTWLLFQRLRREGRLKPRMSLMISFDSLAAWEEMGLGYGQGDPSQGEGWQRLGPVKVQLDFSGRFHPSLAELQEMLAQAQAKGFALAIHAVRDEEVQAAATAIAAAPGRPRRHRIEHCSELSPSSLEMVKRSGATVVTQPAFIYHNGDRYLATVPPERLDWLYRIGSLLRAGIDVAFSSDAPVAPPDPLTAIRAAAARRTLRGQTLLGDEAISIREALAAHTRAAAAAMGQEAERGSIAPGKLADMVLLSGELESDDARVEMTVLGGEVAWRRG